MNRRTSKAVRLGNSIAVILPKDWVRGNGVVKGALLNIEYDSDRLIVNASPAPVASSGAIFPRERGD